MRPLQRSGKLRSSRSLYARDILRPGAVFGSIAERAALALRRAPHRTREREMRLADAPGALPQPPAFALDRVRPGLSERLAGADVALDLAERELAHRDTRADGELRS